MTDATGRISERRFGDRGERLQHRQTVSTPTTCTLTRVVAALTNTAAAADHPVFVQLGAGTPVVVVDISTADGMADVRSDDGRRYTVFAADLEEQFSTVAETTAGEC